MPDDLDNTNDDEQVQQQDSPVIRELREKARRADDNESRAVAAERKLALHEAGLGGLNPTQQKALTAAHEGDWDAEALTATAKELGFGQPAETTEPPKVPDEELAAHQRMADAAGGTAPAPPTDLDAAIDAAQSPEELHQILANAGLLVEEQ